MSMNRLKDRYEGVCPVCDIEIPDDVREGDECLECQYVFEMADPLAPASLEDYEQEFKE